MCLITESASACRTAVIFVLARVGFTRFVSITMNRSCAGSIQIDQSIGEICMVLSGELTGGEGGVGLFGHAYGIQFGGRMCLITESASACRTAVIFVLARVGFTRFGPT